MFGGHIFFFFFFIYFFFRHRLKIICSLIRIQALFNNCSILYRGLAAFYIALGYVNPIGNYYYIQSKAILCSQYMLP